MLQLRVDVSGCPTFNYCSNSVLKCLSTSFLNTSYIWNFKPVSSVVCAKIVPLYYFQLKSFN